MPFSASFIAHRSFVICVFHRSPLVRYSFLFVVPRSFLCLSSRTRARSVFRFSMHHRSFLCLSSRAPRARSVFRFRYRAMRDRSIDQLISMGVAKNAISYHRHNWCVCRHGGIHRAILIDHGRCALSRKACLGVSANRLALSR